jgi:hypothetical protein
LAVAEVEDIRRSISAASGQVAAIFTTREAGAPLRAVPEAILESGKGLVGDRYYARVGKFSKQLEDSADWEITLIEEEEIRRFNESQASPLPDSGFRRNIVIRGIRLNDLVGSHFRVGDALLEGLRLCEPCAYLASLLGPAVVKGMAHRAGLRARIIEGATVRRGDPVHGDS